MADSFFTELKRRNVFKVGVAYLVLAWVVIQVTSEAVPALRLPDWVNSFVFFIGAIGFPFALFFAWVFEVTPDGIKKESDISAEESVTAHTGRKLDFIIIGLLVLVAAYFIYESRFKSLEGPDNTHQTLQGNSSRKTVAVLPFASFSEDKDQSWFADGLTEELLNALARTRDLLVSSRTSSFSYKDSNKDIKTIASELGVDHVLEGSVRRGGERIRVTAQLIRAADGFHLWSQTYDRDYKDIIEIQEDLAVSIANALETAMDPKALSEMMDAGTASIEAYEAYLKANAYFNTDILNTKPIIKLLEQAIKLDPNFTRAMGLLGIQWLQKLDVSAMNIDADDSTDQYLALGTQYLTQAIKILGEGPDVQFYQGLIAQYNLRFKDAEFIYEALLLEYPTYRFAHENLIELKIKMGDRKGAKKLIVNSEQLFTKDLTYHVNNIINNVWIMDTKAASKAADDGIKKFPRHSTVAYQAHRAYLMNNEIDKAKAAMQIVLGSSLAEENKIMVQIRHFCALGQIDNANNLYEKRINLSVSEVSVNWLMSQTMGKIDIAYKYLEDLDQPNKLIQLSSFLYYYHFEVARYPNLKARLEQQGIYLPDPQPVIFGCQLNTET